MTLTDIQSRTVRAQQITGDQWFNGDPVLVGDLRGSVPLLFFWDFACAASLRVLAYVMEFHRKYRGEGLAVVGVHTPRFSFGRDPDLVREAIERLGVSFPVVMDNEALVWTRYENRVWPTIVLVDKDGFLRVRSTGEGHYADLEHQMQTLLFAAGTLGDFRLLVEPKREADRPGAVCYRATPELLGGYLRGSLGNVEGIAPESVVRYADPRLYLDGKFYVHGDWMNGRDHFELQGVDAPGHLVVEYEGCEAHGVMQGREKAPVEVTVLQDDGYLTEDNRGEDVRIAADGRSYLAVARPRLYSLVRNHDFGRHLLRLAPQSGGVRLYAFAFVTGVIPELVSNN